MEAAGASKEHLINIFFLLRDLLPLMDFSNVDIPSSSVLKQVPFLVHLQMYLFTLNLSQYFFICLFQKPVGSNTTMTQTRPVSSAAGKQGSRPTSRTKKTR